MSGKQKCFLIPGKNIFVSEQQNLFPQHMFPARLNWETFASATMFPTLARPLDVLATESDKRPALNSSGSTEVTTKASFFH